MTDRPFSHPNFGREARVEQRGREVRLVFVASTEEQAESLADAILEQLKGGAIHLTMMGKPSHVEERPL